MKEMEEKAAKVEQIRK